MGKIIKCAAIALQVAALLLAPRFGWKIHHPNALPLNYAKAYREDGRRHLVYSDADCSVDISYSNRFLRDLRVSVDNAGARGVTVSLDGAMDGEAYAGDLAFLMSDIVWKDSSGIFYRVYLLAIILTSLSLALYGSSQKKQAGKRYIYKILSGALFFASLLVSLRIII